MKFYPLLFGAERGPKMISILRYAVSFEAAQDNPILQLLVERNMFFVLGACVLVALHGWLARLDWEVALLVGVLVGVLAVFAVYKVGHPQFFISWLAVWAWILAGRSDSAVWRVARAFWPVAVFLSVYLQSDLLTDSYLAGNWEIVRIFASPVFLACVGSGVWGARRDLFRRWQRPGGVFV